MKTEDIVVLALDGLGYGEASRLVEKIGSRVYTVKIHDLADEQGLAVVARLKGLGAKRVWVDYKLHDIPATVKKRAAELVKHGADIITVHASGGVEMMKAAVESGAIVYAVTVLTSLNEKCVRELYRDSPAAVVYALACLSKEANVQGIVCSPLELTGLIELAVGGLELVTPGVRSPGVARHDQERVDTLVNALKNGSRRLVIGRQLTEAHDPVAALDQIAAEIADL